MSNEPDPRMDQELRLACCQLSGGRLEVAKEFYAFVINDTPADQPNESSGQEGAASDPGELAQDAAKGD